MTSIAFCILSVIVELLDRNYYDCHPIIEILLVLVSLFYLIKPTQLWRYYIATICQIIVTFYNMPAVGNHVLFRCIVGAYFITELTLVWYKTKKFPKFGDSFESRIRVNLRLFILSLYFFATLHKLNSDYLNPAVSCAKVILNMAIGLSIPFVRYNVNSTLLSNFLIWSSLVIELFGPMLLLTKRGFKIGLALLVSMHVFLGIFIIDFNFLNFAFLSLFLAPETVTNTYNKCALKISNWPPFKRNLLFSIFVLLCLNFKFSFQTTDMNRYLKIAMNDVLFLCMFSLVLPFLISAFRDNPPEVSTNKPTLLAFPFLLMWTLTAMGPYLGYKNITAVAMYSNLRVEGKSNHLLIPKGALQISDEVDRLISVPPELFRYLYYQRVSFTIPYRNEKILLMPEYEMGRIAFYFDLQPFDQKKMPLTHFVRSEIVQKAKIYYSQSSWWQRKIYGFRPFFDSENMACSW